MIDEEKETQQAAPQKNKSLVVVVASIGVVFALVIIGIVAIVLLGGESNQAQPNAEQEQLSRNIPPVASATNNSNLMNIGPIFQIPFSPPLIVNLSSQGRESYLQTSISIALSSNKLQPEIEKKIDIIKSVIISVLSAKSPDELKTNKGKKKALDEIVDQINEFLVDGKVTNAFFTHFVIQQG